MSRLVELSHVIQNGMPLYPGIPAPVIGAILEHEASGERYGHKAEFLLGKVDLPGNTGTYLDSPYHRYRDGEDLAAIALDRLAALPGVVFDAPPSRRPIDIDFPEDTVRGRAVLIRTGWDRRWGTDSYWEPGPFLTEGTAKGLAASGAVLVGVDFANVDDTGDLARPAHTVLLGAGIVIVEHLTGLEALPRDGFRFSAVPPRIVGGASFPVRAFAELGPPRPVE
jgi:kynurenine formamidase